ncbi:unnamed protein product [Linum trigynum]|uniref:Uncharacterized protein n=1 Tax=Linum trigynum TaxID=586398 RepID=A0AAV2GE03_9ROSI
MRRNIWFMVVLKLGFHRFNNGPFHCTIKTGFAQDTEGLLFLFSLLLQGSRKDEEITWKILVHLHQFSSI